MALDRDAFLARAREHWQEAIRRVGAADQTSATWTGVEQIGRALDPFLGQNVNHAHYPTGGGLDWRSRTDTDEPNCLALAPEERVIDLFCPAQMTLEHFPDRPQESFLLIDLKPLAAHYASDPYRDHQELVEIPGQGYFERSVWDAGYIDHDEFGREVPLPDDARLVSRWLKGKILVVAKGSLWNSTSRTYDGRHTGMTAADIRALIEGAITRQP